MQVAGLRVWGAPWCSLARHGGERGAWSLDDDSLALKFDLIPAGLDLLITNAPPLSTRNGSLGSASLRDAVTRARPLVHCFGQGHARHDHCLKDVDLAYISCDGNGALGKTLCLNAAIGTNLHRRLLYLNL